MQVTIVVGQEPTGESVGDLNSVALALADVDGDGNLDVLAGSLLQNTVRWLRNGGSGGNGGAGEVDGVGHGRGLGAGGVATGLCVL